MPEIQDTTFTFSVTTTKSVSNRMVIDMIDNGSVYTALQCMFGEKIEDVKLNMSLIHTEDGKGVIGRIYQNGSPSRSQSRGSLHRSYRETHSRLDLRVPVRDSKGQFRTISRINPDWIEDREDGLYFGITYDVTKPAIRRFHKKKVEVKPATTHKANTKTDPLEIAALAGRNSAERIFQEVKAVRAPPLPPFLAMLDHPQEIQHIVNLRDQLRRAIEIFNEQDGMTITCDLELKMTRMQETIL